VDRNRFSPLAASAIARPPPASRPQFEAGLKLPVTYHVVIAFDRDANVTTTPAAIAEGFALQ
jgi:hypothetical protein